MDQIMRFHPENTLMHPSQHHTVSFDDFICLPDKCLLSPCQLIWKLYKWLEDLCMGKILRARPKSCWSCVLVVDSTWLKLRQLLYPNTNITFWVVSWGSSFLKTTITCRICAPGKLSTCTKGYYIDWFWTDSMLLLSQSVYLCLLTNPLFY